MLALNFLPLDGAFSYELKVSSESLYLVELVYIFFSILCRRIVAGCIEPYALYSNLNILWIDSASCSPKAPWQCDNQVSMKSAACGLWAYANLAEWFPLTSFCDSKPASHVCYCLNHNNRIPDFSKLVSTYIKKWWLVYLLLQNWWSQLIY